MAKEVNVHITTETDKQKVDAYGNSFDSAGKKVNSAGGQAQGASRKMTALGSAITTLSRHLLGFASITALFTFFKTWLSYVEKIAEAQKQLVESTKSLDQAAKSLAGQAGIMGKKGGVEAAREQILAIQTAGKLGSFEAAEGVAVSAHSAFGTSGQLLTPGQLGIASATANFARLKDISPGAIDDLFKVLAAEGVSNEDEAKLRIQQLSTVQQASKVKSFEEFMPGAIKSMIPAMAKGASPEMALSQYAAALDTSASADLAAESTKQAADIMLRPDVAAAIGGGFANLPYDKQIAAFSQWVTRSTNEQLMAAKLEPTQVGRMKTLYKPGQLGRVVMFRGLSASSTAEKLSAELAGWDETTPGQKETIQAEAVRTGASATKQQQLGAAIIAAAKVKFEQRKAMGQTDWRVKEPVEQELIITRAFQQRIQKLKAAGEDTTQIESLLEEIYPSTTQGLGAAKSIFKQVMPFVPATELTPEEVGQAELMLQGMETKAGITINNYHNDTIFARPGVDPSPRVSPADIE